MTSATKEIVDTEKLAQRRRQLDERHLSTHAYSQRRAMMIMSAGTFAVSWGGIRLSEINVFGVGIGTWDERYLLGFAGLVLAYLIGNFASLVQPTVMEWRSDFEWFSHETSNAVQQATSEIETGARHAREALGHLVNADVEKLRDLLKEIDVNVQQEVTRRNHAAFESYRSRLRFEYTVPLGIALFVLFAVVLRLVILFA